MLSRSDLWSLEDYSEVRSAFRSQVLSHKQHRRVQLGDAMQLIFEDRLTVKYQIQEMLRIEKIFEARGIQEELDAYNPLIPDGDNWKCTLLIQYEDVEERKRRLTDLLGVEDKIWLEIAQGKRVWPIADEDMDRSTDDKTAAVHFIRYQLTADDIALVKSGGAITFGVDHVAYPCNPVQPAEEVRLSLMQDIGGDS
jgi:hypothetical protein